ncbi:MAG: hypothetical protein HQK89_09075 [Nitrospirae bacterium]|nr:hypothetical protein [Nitrospirota bacterium]
MQHKKQEPQNYEVSGLPGFIKTLRNSGVDFTSLEIADVLWLAGYLDKPTETPKDLQQPKPQIQPKQSKTDSPKEILPEPKVERREPPSKKSHDQYAGVRAFDKASEVKDSAIPAIGGTAFKAPGVSAIAERLSIGKALRPLKKNIPSRHMFILDEEETAHLIADSGVLLPVFKPVPSRWLEVILVADESSSMIVWQSTILELKLLMERVGAFRNVQLWGFNYDKEQKQIRLRTGMARKASCTGIRRPEELVDTSGRRLIVIISDCVSSAWYDGKVTAMMDLWQKNSILTILQVLPHWFWRRTAIDIGHQCYFRYINSGFEKEGDKTGSFIELDNFPVDTNEYKDDEPVTKKHDGLRSSNVFDGSKQIDVKVPIITLEPDSMFFWAQSIAGFGDKWIPGVVFSVIKEGHELAARVFGETQLQFLPDEPMERLRIFRSTASSKARQLAGYLSVVPLTLPVMLLVQRTMLRQSSQIHLAEIFLSGIIEMQTDEGSESKPICSQKGANDSLEDKKSGDSISINPNTVRYEFPGNLREYLQAGITENDISTVLKTVSRFINSKTGEPIDFNAVLADPSLSGNIRIDESSKSFATISPKVLKILGGRYAELARHIEERFNTCEHPVFFGSVLVDNAHPLHDIVLNEWFGLLGVFCFKNLLKLRVEIKKFDLDTIDESTGRELFSALKIASHADWKQIFLIYISDTLIGATSPASLFYTPHSYKCPESIPWRNDNGQLISPYVFYNNNNNDKYKNIFANWIATVNAAIKKAALNEIKDIAVRQQLNKISALMISIIPGVPMDIQTATKPLIGDIPYSFFTHCVLPENRAQVESASSKYAEVSELFVNSPFEGKKTTIIVHSTLWKKDYRVYKGYRTSSFNMPEGSSGNTLNTGQINNLWINPEKLLLTEKLMKIGVIEKSMSFLLTDNENATYALPLTADFFDYFGADNLKPLGEEREHDTGLGITANTHGKNIILTIPIANGEKVRIEKHYAPNDIISIDGPWNPLLELWPDFKANSWNKYYVITEKQEELEIKPVGSIDGYKIDQFNVYEVKDFKAAFECKYNGSAAGVLLPKLKLIEREGDTWDVAVDFGTTYTIVSYSEGDDIKIFSFKTNSDFTLQLLERDFVERANILDAQFFSSQVASIEHPFIYNQINYYGNGSSIIKDGVIYFPNPTIGETSKSLNITGDLKWQAENPNRADEAIKKVRIFLGHILMIVCAKARSMGCTAINLSWTYPSAYSEFMKSQVLQDNWERIIREVSSQTGITTRIKAAVSKSVAVCKYMIKSHGLVPAGKDPNVVMDIGGGTTDIGIWFNNNLALQTYFKLAGNILAELIGANSGFCSEFLQYVKRNEESLSVLDTKREPEDQLEKKLKANPALYLNLILSHPQNKVDFTGFKYGRSVLYFALSSLFYYTGLLLASIDSKKLQSKIVYIYLGGNASKLFKLIWKFDWGDANATNPLFKSLKETLIAGSGSKIDDVHMVLPTTSFKEEAVRGALEGMIRFNDLALPCLITGERGLTMHNKKVDGSETEIRLDVFDDLLLKFNGSERYRKLSFSFEGEDLEIEKFVACYNERNTLNGLQLHSIRVDKKVYPRIANFVVQKYLMEELNKTKDRRILQPLFISEVKQLCLTKDIFTRD